MHSTDYFNTFIEIAEDCPAMSAEIPDNKAENKTTAQMQFEMLTKNPYTYTSDEVVFTIFALRNGISPNDQVQKAIFFSKGQACLRASPLGKRYGWGLHYNEEGKIALYPFGSEEYERLKADPSLTHTKAMRSKKAT